jgi:hypothetical protein
VTFAIGQPEILSRAHRSQDLLDRFKEQQALKPMLSPPRYYVKNRYLLRSLAGPEFRPENAWRGTLYPFSGYTGLSRYPFAIQHLLTSVSHAML